MVRVSASEAAVLEVGFGFSFLKFLAVWNSALAVDFLEWGLAVFAFSELVDAAWLSDNDCFFIVFVSVLDEVSTCEFASVVGSEIVAWGAFLLDFNIEVLFIQTLITHQPESPSAAHTSQALVFDAVNNALEIADTFSRLIQSETSQG